MYTFRINPTQLNGIPTVHGQLCRDGQPLFEVYAQTTERVLALLQEEYDAVCARLRCASPEVCIEE